MFLLGRFNSKQWANIRIFLNLQKKAKTVFLWKQCFSRFELQIRKQREKKGWASLGCTRSTYPKHQTEGRPTSSVARITLCYFTTSTLTSRSRDLDRNFVQQH